MSVTRWSTRWILACTYLFAALGPVLAQDTAAIEKEVSLLLRALPLEKAAASRFADGVRVIVVHAPEASSEAAVVVAAFLAGNSELLAVDARAVAFKSTASLLAAVDDGRINVVYIDPSMAAALSSVHQVSRARKILSIGSSAEMVSQGSSLGAVSVGGTPRLLVNLRAWKVEGVDFGEAILKVAKAVE